MESGVAFQKIVRGFGPISIELKSHSLHVLYIFIYSSPKCVPAFVYVWLMRDKQRLVQPSQPLRLTFSCILAALPADMQQRQAKAWSMQSLDCALVNLFQSGLSVFWWRIKPFKFTVELLTLNPAPMQAIDT